MGYNVSLTNSTSKTFSTVIKSVAALLVIASVVLPIVYIHANNLWWFVGAVIYSVLGLVFTFGWAFYVHRGRELAEARNEIRDLRQILMKGGININLPEQERNEEPKKVPAEFTVMTEPTVRDKELSPAEYKRLEKIWEEEYGGKNRTQIGYQNQSLAPTPPEDRWRFDPVSGKFLKKR